MAQKRSANAASKSRSEQERARIYQARKDFHEGKIRRRSRDNVVASVAGGFLVLAAIASQSVHAVVLDNAVEPEPTFTITPTPSNTPSPEPTETDAPTETPSPEPTDGDD